MEFFSVPCEVMDVTSLYFFINIIKRRLPTVYHDWNNVLFLLEIVDLSAHPLKSILGLEEVGYFSFGSLLGG